MPIHYSSDAQRGGSGGEGDRGALPSLIAALPDHAIVRIDAQGRINGWGTAADTLFGWSAKEILGHSVERLFAPGTAATLIAHFAPGGGRKRETADDQCRHKTGADFRAITSLTSIAGAGGAIEGFWLVVRDVTEERRPRARSRRARSCSLRSSSRSPTR